MKWPKVKLGEVLRRSAETVILQPEAEYREITVRRWHGGVIERGRILGSQIAEKKRFVVRNGQFVYSKLDARNGSYGIIPPALDGAVVSSEYPAFYIDQTRLSDRFLWWMTYLPSFLEAFVESSEGSGRVRVRQNRVLSLEISLPSLPEQRQVVAHIEDIVGQIDKARSLRHLVLLELEALRISCLRNAIQKCRAMDIELQDACEAIIDNLHSNPRYADTGVPCVRSPDVGWGTLNLEGALVTSEDEYRCRTVRGEPQINDIVLVREGGGTGKAAIVLPGQRFSLGQRVMMLRPYKQKVLPRFFLYQLLSPAIQEDQILPLSKGSASPHLNIGALRRFRLKLPSISDQHRIVTELDTLLERLDVLKHSHHEVVAELDALLPSILDRAFKGEL